MEIVMEIIERFICGKKGSTELCEDALIITPQLVAVIDGVTAKGGLSWNGMSSGRYASKNLEKALYADNIWKMDSVQMFTYLDACLHHMWGEAKISDQEIPRASAIIYNNKFRQIWAYGDCQCMINGVLHSHSKKIDELTSNLRSFFLEYKLLQGTSESSFYEDDPGRKAIEPLLNMQFAFENRIGPWGYPVLNGKGICPEMIVTYTIQPGDEVILASDGYPCLMNTLTKSESGLKEILKKDPLCYRLYLSTKGMMKDAVSFDDRCYCRIRV